MMQTWSLTFWRKKQSISGSMCYLRLMRRALSRPSRSLARISFLFSSSSTTFSATEDRLLALRSRMTAPRYIWVDLTGHKHQTLKTGFMHRISLHLRFQSHLCSWSFWAGSSSWRRDGRHEKNSIFQWRGLSSLRSPPSVQSPARCCPWAHSAPHMPMVMQCG